MRKLIRFCRLFNFKLGQCWLGAGEIRSLGDALRSSSLTRNGCSNVPGVRVLVSAAGCRDCLRFWIGARFRRLPIGHVYDRSSSGTQFIRPSRAQRWAPAADFILSGAAPPHPPSWRAVAGNVCQARGGQPAGVIAA